MSNSKMMNYTGFFLGAARDKPLTLNQIITELIDNAIDSLYRKIAQENTDNYEPIILIKILDGALAIYNNGKGIPRNSYKKIFTLFNLSENNNTKNGKYGQGFAAAYDKLTLGQGKVRFISNLKNIPEDDTRHFSDMTDQFTSCTVDHGDTIRNNNINIDHSDVIAGEMKKLWTDIVPNNLQKKEGVLNIIDLHPSVYKELKYNYDTHDFKKNLRMHICRAYQQYITDDKIQIIFDFNGNVESLKPIQFPTSTSFPIWNIQDDVKAFTTNQKNNIEALYCSYKLIRNNSSALQDFKNNKMKIKKYKEGEFTNLIETNGGKCYIGFKGTRQKSMIKISDTEKAKIFDINNNGSKKEELFRIDSNYIPEWKRKRGILADNVKLHIQMYSTMENPTDRQIRWYIRDFVSGFYYRRHKRIIKINMPGDYIADTRSKKDGWDTYHYTRSIISPIQNNNETDKIMGIFADKDVMYEHMIEEIMRDTIAVVLLVCNKIILCNYARIPRTKKELEKLEGPYAIQIQKILRGWNVRKQHVVNEPQQVVENNEQQQEVKEQPFEDVGGVKTSSKDNITTHVSAHNRRGSRECKDIREEFINLNDKMLSDTTKLKKGKKYAKDLISLAFKMNMDYKNFIKIMEPVILQLVNQYDDDDGLPAGADFIKLFEKFN